MNPFDVLKYGNDVIYNQPNKVNVICQTAGGWENWMQCELAYLILKKENVGVIREEHVWDSNSGWKCELLIQDEREPDNPYLIVEIKALGWKRAQGNGTHLTQSAYNDFLAQVDYDFTKLRTPNIYNAKGISILWIPAFPGIQDLTDPNHVLDNYRPTDRGVVINQDLKCYSYYAEV